MRRRGPHPPVTWRGLPVVGLVVLLVVMTGCLGVFGGEGLRFTADPVTIDDRTVAEAGFERVGTDTLEFERTVGSGDASTSVVVSSHVVTLRRQYRGAPIGHVVAVSSPKATVLGRSVNPLGMVGSQELVERVLGQSTDGEVDGLERTGNVSMRSLGAERTVGRFDASGDGGAVQVYLTRFEHGDDYVIVFGVIPDGAEGGTDAFRTVLAGVRHDGT